MIKKFPEFSRFFHSHNYAFSAVIATKNFGNLAAFRAILATFSPCLCRNCYFRWHLLGRVTALWDHNDSCRESRHSKHTSFSHLT